MAEGRASAALVGLQRLPPSLSGRPRDLLVVCGRLGSFKDCAGRQGSLAGFQGTVFLPSQGDEMTGTASILTRLRVFIPSLAWPEDPGGGANARNQICGPSGGRGAVRSQVFAVLREFEALFSGVTYSPQPTSAPRWARCLSGGAVSASAFPLSPLVLTSALEVARSEILGGPGPQPSTPWAATSPGAGGHTRPYPSEPRRSLRFNNPL